ncbi:putative MFS family arabinose efflux permease [Nocardioides albertanoniae]|uniref:Putative MFS family arabinose efflux permease n=1 Tax=Nocardioides albertanoniae TaxID=1175486 RepID=A0A543A3N3_9ACTN|nr:MFS transporter [Nocardioides albertanoniae]TQL67076.1 putative MFS family arabinose efflux permease [Nocardioides albertanoniae]
MSFQTYAELWRIPDVRRILVLGLFLRLPMPASAVIVTLHVVGPLDRSYAEAGLVSTVLAIAMAISAPWLGRLLDRLGLRRTLLLPLAVLPIAWSVAPWVGYLPLLALVAVAGLFTVPSFSVVRQVMIRSVGPGKRTAALSADAVMTELCFMTGPLIGVLGASYLGTSWALMLSQWLGIVAAVGLWLLNPAITESESVDPAEATASVPAVAAAIPAAVATADGGAAEPSSRRWRLPTWVSPGVVLLLAGTFAASLILVAEDLGTVAAMRDFDRTTYLGLVMAVWALGSLLGALIYGALNSHPSAAMMLVLLGATTMLAAIAPEPISFAALLLVSGFFCAPTLTAALEAITSRVSSSVRGEVMGWHGSAITLGSAVGAPAAGFAIDMIGWQGGFLLGGGLGLLISTAIWLTTRRISKPYPEASGLQAE